MTSFKAEKGKINSKEILYQGPIFTLEKLNVTTPDGLTVNRDLIRHPDAVSILAFDDDDNVLVNREYRVGVNQETLAIPAGMLEANEDPLIGAQREIKEETGYELDQYEVMTSVTTSEGFTNERIYLIVGHFDPSKRSKTNFDDDEFVTTKRIPFTQLLKWIEAGTVQSAQTISAVGYYQMFKNK